MFAAKVSSLLISRVSPEGDRLAGPVHWQAWERLPKLVRRIDEIQVNIVLRRRGSVVLADGSIHVQAFLGCERCLGDLPWDAEISIAAGLGDSEDAIMAVDAEREPVLSIAGTVAVQDWLEEEVLLALPMLARCNTWKIGICPISGVEVPAVGPDSHC